MREWLTGVPRVWRARSLFALALVFVVWQSLVPAEQIVVQAPSDKVSHVAAYALLGFLAALSVRRWRWVLALVIVTVSGALVEVAQSRTSYRAFEYSDIVADFIGAAIGASVAVAAHALWRRRPSP